ncbi:TIGR00297 family protein [Bacillus sp. OV322]|nr:TIGR00297 family protein [Bacillus sp. OV322]
MLTDVIYMAGIAAAAIAAYAAAALSKSGMIAAIAVGISVELGFHLPGLLLLGAFFVSSSLLSKIKSKEKRKAEKISQKGSRRDAVQVLANGGASAVFSLLYWLHPSQLFLLLFIVCLAAANSDTWASEIGVLSKKRPWHLLNFKKAERGTSGAVSLTGTIAAISGSLFIALLSMVLLKELTIDQTLKIALSGFIGCLADTLLGGAVQAEYTCHICGGRTEKTIHCDEKTILAKGISWVNNDVVNAASIMIAALFLFIITTRIAVYN